MDRTGAFEGLDPLGLDLAYLEPRDGEFEDEREQIPAELLLETPFAESAGEVEMEAEAESLVTDLEGFEAEAGTAHSFSGCTKAEKALLIDAADQALHALRVAVACVGTAHGRPDRMSAALRQLLLRHFHSTQRKHLRFILTRLMRIIRAFEGGIRFQAQRSCKAGPAGMVCGYAYSTQLFGGFGKVNICFDPRPRHCSFNGMTPEERQTLIIHEVAHRYVGIEDKAYIHDSKYASLSASQALDNADSYAFFSVEGRATLKEAIEPEFDVAYEEFGASDGEQFADLEWNENLAPASGIKFPSGLVLPVTSGATGPYEEHWDPNGANLPLLETGPYLSRNISPHFTVKEFVSSGGNVARIARISPELVRVLELIRVRAGRALKITSGYRSWKYNEEIYKRRKKRPTFSQHCSGQAVDCRIAGMGGIELAKLAIDVAGPNLGIGLARTYIHLDLRGCSQIWNYVGGAWGDRAAAEIKKYAAKLGPTRCPRRPPPPPRPRAGTVPLKPPPSAPTRPAFPSAPAPAQGNRLVIDRHPLLTSHHDRAPDLVLKWNALPRTGPVDVVVHFHGYSGNTNLLLTRDKEPISGLDFADRKSGTPGRTRPTLAILPRGKYVGDQPKRNPQAYAFPALTGPGELDALIKDSLARVGAATGRTLTLGRLIITGHSGGGAPVRAVLGHTDPDEVHIFDGTYGPADDAIYSWAKKKIERELLSPSATPPALRVLYIPKTGTAREAERLWQKICPLLAPANAASLRNSFRVERTQVDHNDIPPRFGWQLLADASADLPSTTRLSCGPSSLATESGEETWRIDPATSTEWTEAGLSEAPVYELEGLEGELEEDREETSGFEAEEEAEELWFEPEWEDREEERSGRGEELAWLDHEGVSERQWAHAPSDVEGEWEEELEWEDKQEVEWTGEQFERLGKEESSEEAGYFERDLSETDRLLQAGNWRGAVKAAIKAGERDEARLTNLVFFFRHPELDRTRPLQPKASKADAALAKEWNKISRNEIWPAIADFARDPVLAVDGQQIASRITHFRGQAGKRFKQLIEAAAQMVGLNPGLLAAVLISEIGTRSEYLSASKVSSYRVGVDDFYVMREKLRKAVPAYKKIRWDEKQTPEVHSNDAKKPTPKMTIWFDSGPDGLLATAVYLKYGEVRLRSLAKELGGDFDTLPVETRFALTRMTMANRVTANDRLAAALKGQDILVRNWAPPKIYVTERNATIRAAEAMFLSGWVFGQLLTPRPPVRLQPEQFETSEEERFYTAPWEREEMEETEENEELAWLAYERGGAELFEEEEESEEFGEETGEPGFREAEWAEVDSFESAEAEFFDPEDREDTENFSETLDDYSGEEESADISTLEALLEIETGSGELSDRLKGVAAFVLGPTLRRGSSGPAVVSLQVALTELGHPGIAADGKFGPITEQAVRRFQTASGLTPDGIVGPHTKAALATALGRRVGPTPQPPQPHPVPPRRSGKKLAPTQFVAAYQPFAKASEARHRVPALVALGQAALESGWGAHAAGYNFFGIKAKESDPSETRQLFRTTEVYSTPDRKVPRLVAVRPRPDGKYTYVVDDWFRIYPDPAAAFDGHGELLARNKRYANAFTVASDPYAFATEVTRAGYATAPDYAPMLHSVMRAIESASST